MKYLSTKEQLKEYLSQQTPIFKIEKLSYFTTKHMSSYFNISRSVTSQYLNELYKEGELIKINSRPVYFLDKKSIEKKYGEIIEDHEFFNISDLMKTLTKNKFVQKDFYKAIGNNGSISYTITQLKTALLYPPQGLPIVLYGEEGVGKEFLADLTFEFLKNEKLLQNESKYIKIIILKNTTTDYIKEIFGYRNLSSGEIKTGLLEEAKDGMIYISNASSMSEKCQQKLSEYLSLGKYTCVNDVQNIQTSRTRVVLSTLEDPYQSLSQNLLINIPVVAKIPSLDVRSEEEKIEFILKFFTLEEETIQKDIKVSKRLLQVLMDYPFSNNLNGLKKCIQRICANAYLQHKDDKSLDVYIYNLPSEILSHLDASYKSELNDEELISIHDFKKSETSINILYFFDHLIDCYIEYEKNNITFSEFLDQGFHLMREYYDYIIFEEKYKNSRVKAVEKLINNILEDVKSRARITLPLNCGFTISRILNAIQKIQSSINVWEKERLHNIKSCFETLIKELPNEYVLTKQIAKNINNTLDVKITYINQIFILLNIHFYNKNLKNQDIVGIIICHGYSTASSISDAVNSLLGENLFEAIDMPLNTDIEEVAFKVNEYIKSNYYYKNIILMVDMGSLEGVIEQVKGNVNIGIVNNVSTSLALNVGLKIIQQMGIEKILQNVCKESICKYKFISAVEKETAIVFTSDAGEKVSSKISELFKQSLPKQIQLKFLDYDYKKLMKNKSEDILFKKYDVVLMIKPYTLDIENINSVTLEDIVNFKDIRKVHQALKPYLSEEEIEVFNQRLLKNFSLHSVMENLTILNANKLLDYVSEAVSHLQVLLGQKFQSKTIIGIYIHICFLVERLVTKNAIEIYDNLDGFEKSHPDFIKHVHNSFELMLRNYNVEMPISEIAYLYDYILNDRKGGEK
ncbi:sigma 54-interacting transcriptional regulator [Clostridium brassicae]|uniref:Sigma 54-interacting transcriptional regulator n=1 Tax=Clostridium brassicae TaxID=2999072 RepID=A0ABT4D8B8_9CLOT|nr:sigma 54-interacting transcriptional regulator [Clostridium brassicae]MCY6958403.1 sigma 54-interacting transcriptional regulator [Clostridium brassicae]